MRLHASALLALSIVLASTAASAAETLRLRADNWMPFNGDPKADKPGYVIEICKAIYGPLGITLDYQVLPWAEAVKAARAGEIDGVIGADPTEGAGLVFPKESINALRIALFGKKGINWKLENPGSYAKVRIGVVPGYAYWEGLDTYIKSAKPPKIMVFEGDSPTVDAIKKLNAGEIDLFPENLIVFGWNARALGLKTSDFTPCYINTGDDIYVAFTPKSDKSKRWTSQFDEGIARLRKTGELKKILTRYGLEDWK